LTANGSDPVPTKNPFPKKPGKTTYAPAIR
jgi:hypothetical protein